MENNNSNQENANTGEAAAAAAENLNGVAGWVISAFFSSLERFSCVNVSTFDPDDSDEEEEEDGDRNSPIAPSRDSSNLPV